MDNIALSLESLLNRLPELEWILDQQAPILDPKQLPRGLFTASDKYTSRACLEEIRDNIQEISMQTSDRAKCYLAERIQQKIYVLVHICKQVIEIKTPKQSPVFSVDILSTRQQRLHTLQDEIMRLRAQQLAVEETYAALVKSNAEAVILLNAKKKLGEVARCLGEAEEMLHKV